MHNLRSLRLVLSTQYAPIDRHLAHQLKRQPKGTPYFRQMMRNFLASTPESVTFINLGEEDGGGDQQGGKVFIFNRYMSGYFWTLEGKLILPIYEELKTLQSTDLGLYAIPGTLHLHAPTRDGIRPTHDFLRSATKLCWDTKRRVSCLQEQRGCFTNR
jgi:hypothetical protein